MQDKNISIFNQIKDTACGDSVGFYKHNTIAAVTGSKLVIEVKFRKQQEEAKGDPGASWRKRLVREGF